MNFLYNPTIRLVQPIAMQFSQALCVEDMVEFRVSVERHGSLLRPREFVLIARTIVKVDNAVDRHTCSALLA